MSNSQSPQKYKLHILPPKTQEEIVIELQKQKQFEQRTQEWFEQRRHVITASEFYKIYGTRSKKEELITGKIGIGKPFQGSVATRWGVQFEPIAIKCYEN